MDDEDNALPPHAARLERAAQRIETPTSGGQMVWHCWGEGKPIVLLHGGSGSWTHWLRNIEPLAARGRRVFRPPSGIRPARRPPASGELGGWH